MSSPQEIANRHAKAAPMADDLFRRCMNDSRFRQTITTNPDDGFWLVIAVDAGVSDGSDDYVPSIETRAYTLFLLDEMIKNASDPFAGIYGRAE